MVTAAMGTPTRIQSRNVQEIRSARKDVAMAFPENPTMVAIPPAVMAVPVPRMRTEP